MKLFFLGGTSYLGKELIQRFASHGHEIAAYVRSPESAKKLSGLEVRTVYELTEIPDQDVVFNLIVDYGKDKDLSEVMAINVDYPLSALKNFNFKSIINFSTGLGKTVSHYANSKKVLEEELIRIGRKRGFQVVNLQLQHFYGPGAPAHNFVSFLITKLLKNEEILLTDCQQKRDFIFTDDVLDGVELILSELNHLSQAETMEIGSGESVKLQTFIEILKKETASLSLLRFGIVPRRPNEPDELLAEIDRLRALGWTPKTTLNEGILKTISQYRYNKSVN